MSFMNFVLGNGAGCGKHTQCIDFVPSKRPDHRVNSAIAKHIAADIELEKQDIMAREAEKKGYNSTSLLQQGVLFLKDFAKVFQSRK